MVLPKAGKKLQVVSWATGDYTTAAGSSHAERYFVDWLSGQDWKNRVVSIGIENMPLNPCEHCGGQLVALLQDLNHLRSKMGREPVRARIAWSKPWAEEDIGVIQGTLGRLRQARWNVVPAEVDGEAYKKAYDAVVKKRSKARRVGG